VVSAHYGIAKESAVPFSQQEGQMKRMFIAALLTMTVGPALAGEDDPAYTCSTSLQRGESMIDSAAQHCKAGDQMLISNMSDDESVANVIRLICDLRYEVVVDQKFGGVIACIYRPLQQRPYEF